jgi:hypothetical protein
MPNKWGLPDVADAGEHEDAPTKAFRRVPPFHLRANLMHDNVVCHA